MKTNFLQTIVSLSLLLSLPMVCRSQGLTVTIAQETGTPPAGALSPRWIFTMTFANGAAGAYKTDHFQLFTSIPNSFDPVNDNCMFQYSRYGAGNGTFSIFGDTPYVQSDYGPWSAWNSGIVENSQCRVWSQHAVQSVIGNDLKLTFPVEGKVLMEGKYGIYVEHGTWGGYSNGWNGFGNYYTPLWQPVNLPLPNLPTKTFLQTFGSGMNTVLDASMSSTGVAGNGVKAISRALLIGNTTSAPDGVNACYAIYHRTSHELAMLDDGGNNALSSRILGNVPGASNVVQGNQCAMNLGLSWYDENLTTTRLLVPVTFTSSFANRPGVKNLFFVPIDRAGQGPSTSASDGTWPPSSLPVSDFSLSIPSNSATVMAGTPTVSYTVVVNPINGFAGAVSFSTAGLPGGASATFNPPTVVGSGATTLTVNAPAYHVGTFNFSVSGQYGAASRGASAIIKVHDFALTISPGSQTIQPFGTAAYTISATGLNGYNQPVTVSSLSSSSCAGYDLTAITVPVWPASIPMNTSVNVSIGSVSSPGAPIFKCLNVTATSGGVSRQANMALKINTNANPSADFSLGVSSAQLVSIPGVANFGISASAINSFAGSIVLSATGPSGSPLPTGISASFTQSTIVGGSGATNLLLNALSSALPGTYPIEIRGVSGTLLHVTSTFITVQSSQTFTISATPGTQTATQTGVAGYTVLINTNQSFSGSISLSATGLPSGANASFNPGTITNSGVAGVTIATSSTPIGNYPITIRATDGVTTRTAAALLIVNAPTAAKMISPSPGSTLTSGAVTFQWDSGVGAFQYQLLLGSSQGASDYLTTLPTAALSVSTVLPGPTRTLYATLNSFVSGVPSRYYVYTIGPAASGDPDTETMQSPPSENFLIPNNNQPTVTGPFVVKINGNPGNGRLATKCAIYITSGVTSGPGINGTLDYPSSFTPGNSSSYDVKFTIPSSVSGGEKAMVCAINGVVVTKSNFLTVYDGSPFISTLTQFDPEYSGGPFYISVFGSNFGPAVKTLTVCPSDGNPNSPCVSTPNFTVCLPLAGSVVNPSCPYAIWKDDQINALLTPTSSTFGTYDVQVTSSGAGGLNFFFNPQVANKKDSNKKGTLTKPQLLPIKIFIIHGIGDTSSGMQDIRFNLASTLNSDHVVDATFNFLGCSSIAAGGVQLASHVLLNTMPGQRVAFVGHSMGGIVIRSMLRGGWLRLIDPTPNKRLVVGLATLGSPHLGYPILPEDSILKCPIQEDEMASYMRQDPFQMSTFLQDLQANWNFAAVGGQWFAAAGRSCSSPVRVSLIPNPDGPPLINGCRDINPFSDGVICHDSAMLFHPQALPQVGTNLTPSIQWSDDSRFFQHAADIGPTGLNVLCGNITGAVSIINPSATGQLFMALKDFLNALR